MPLAIAYAIAATWFGWLMWSCSKGERLWRRAASAVVCGLFWPIAQLVALCFVLYALGTDPRGGR